MTTIHCANDAANLALFSKEGRPNSGTSDTFALASAPVKNLKHTFGPPMVTAPLNHSTCHIGTILFLIFIKKFFDLGEKRLLKKEYKLYYDTQIISIGQCQLSSGLWILSVAVAESPGQALKHKNN